MTDREPTAIEALRQKAVRASCCDACDWPKCGCRTAASLFDAMVAAIAPLPVLAWAANNPETLAALASGEMVLADIAVERQRQIAEEGWTREHDDQHKRGEMAQAAACYALQSTHVKGALIWPWEREWWKPTTRRRELIKAGALIVAEIERLDRLAALPDPNPTDNSPMAKEA